MPLTEQDVRDAVLSSASTNSALLVKLAETENAPGEFALHLKNLSRLREDVQEQQKTLDTLKSQVEAKLRVHKKYNNNVTRKLFYRASFMREKFDVKAMQGEQEYFSVLALQGKAEDRQSRLQLQLDVAENAGSGLQARAEEHGATHERIDELYEELFAGPTPGFDREDSLESRFYAARGNHDTVRGKIITSRQAARHLKTALRNVARAESYADNALTQLESSFFISDEPAYWLRRYNQELEYASSAFLQATDALHSKTHRAGILKSTTFRALERAKAPSGVPSSRDAYRTAIVATQTQVKDVRAHVQSFLELTATIEKSGLSEIRNTARALEDSRQALQQSRMGIFEDVAGFGQAAPSYRECCDRADGFCVLPPPPPEEPEDDGQVSPELPGYSEANANAITNANTDANTDANTNANDNANNSEAPGVSGRVSPLHGLDMPRSEKEH